MEKKQEMEGGNRKCTLVQCLLLTLLKYWKALSMKVSRANITNVMDMASHLRNHSDISC